MIGCKTFFEKKSFQKEEMKKIKSFGDFDKLLEMLKKRLNEQKKKKNIKEGINGLEHWAPLLLDLMVIIQKVLE